MQDFQKPTSSSAFSYCEEHLRKLNREIGPVKVKMPRQNHPFSAGEEGSRKGRKKKLEIKFLRPLRHESRREDTFPGTVCPYFSSSSIWSGQEGSWWFWMDFSTYACVSRIIKDWVSNGNKFQPIRCPIILIKVSGYVNGDWVEKHWRVHEHGKITNYQALG